MDPLFHKGQNVHDALQTNNPRQRLGIAGPPNSLDQPFSASLPSRPPPNPNTPGANTYVLFPAVSEDMMTAAISSAASSQVYEASPCSVRSVCYISPEDMGRDRLPLDTDAKARAATRNTSCMGAVQSVERPPLNEPAPSEGLSRVTPAGTPVDPNLPRLDTGLAYAEGFRVVLTGSDRGEDAANDSVDARPFHTHPPGPRPCPPPFGPGEAYARQGRQSDEHRILLYPPAAIGIDVPRRPSPAAPSSAQLNRDAPPTTTTTNPRRCLLEAAAASLPPPPSAAHACAGGTHDDLVPAHAPGAEIPALAGPPCPPVATAATVTTTPGIERCCLLGIPVGDDNDAAPPMLYYQQVSRDDPWTVYSRDLRGVCREGRGGYTT